MKILSLALAAALALPAAHGTTARLAHSFHDAGSALAERYVTDGDFATVPPAANAPADPADSLYRAARATLNRGDYARAADMFERLYHDFPKSAYAADAPYWRAFALYRRGDADEATLRDALAALDLQRTTFPNAGTRGDARALELRIKGRLAQLGDAGSAEDVTEAASDAADDAAMAAEAKAAKSGTKSAKQISRAARDAERDAARAGRGMRGADSEGSGCSDEDDDRIAALNALLQMSPERAVPILKKVLARRDACAEVLRRKAVFLVAQKVTPETEDILIDVSKNDPDAEVRQQAVFWLSQVNTDKAVTALETILRTSKDPELQEKALFALSQHPRERAGEMLREVAGRDSAPEEIREKAIFWLGQRHSADNATFLRTLFGRLTNQELKEKILFSLSQMRGAGNDKWLMDVATNPKEDIELRKKALFWAGQGGVAIGDVVAMYDRMPDQELKEQAIFVLSQRHESAAVDKLLAIAKTEKDRELRKKAIFWLSQSRDPRVAQFLEQLLQQ